MKVTFRPFTKEEYFRFEEWEIEAYADALVRSKTESKEDALCISAEEIEEMLPDGLDTKGNFFFTAVTEDGKDAGFIWYSETDVDEIFISELFVSDEYKDKGAGEAILSQLEKESQASLISLHVFDCDKEALKLYKNAGYEVYAHNPPASTYMKKEVSL